MGMIVAYNETNVIARDVIMADTFFGRLTGLMPKKTLVDGEGMILKPCKQVHTYFMGYSIDVIFLTEENRIIYLQSNMEPGRVSSYIKKANSVLEVPEGTINKWTLKVGDVLDISDNQ
ncbi:MAG: DUF192 domain-containing protein [Eubacteriales bacterium]|nr:DUF192 domain-containing protein [Eubacteriales bacterium]